MNRIARLIILIGVCFMCLGIVLTGFNFNKLFNPFVNIEGKYEKKTMTIENKDLEELVIRIADVPVEIIPTTDDVIRITYYESKTEKYSYKETDTTFTLTKKDEIVFFNFDFTFFLSNKVLVEVPEDMILAYDIKISNAKIEINGLIINSSTFKTDNGKIVVDNVQTEGNLELNTNNGSVSLNKVTADIITLGTDNGKATLTGVNAAVIDVDSSNGTINMKSVQAFAKITAKTSNGPINITNLSSPNIKLTTSNGSVKGNILGDEDTYNRELKTSNGKIIVNGTTYGESVKDRKTQENNLYIKTSNGRIDININ